MWIRYVASLAVLAVGSWVFAQDVQSGPDKDKKAPELKIYDVTGPQQGKTVDYVKERKGEPTVYVLVQADKWSRPTHAFIKALEEALPKKYETGRVVAIWLTDDQDKTKEYLPKIANLYQSTVLAYFPGEKTGPADWNINDQADVTIVVANKGQVLHSAGYGSVNDTMVREVLQKFGKPKKK